MITPSDKEYQATKLVKQGKVRLLAPFDELAMWISSTWKVFVLNIIYDRSSSLHAPRLQIIFEYEEDVSKFRDGLNFDEEKQSSIASKFLTLVSTFPKNAYEVSGLFVVFSGFDRIAKQEADGRITDEMIATLQARIGNPDLWSISRCFGHVSFMFYTDALANWYESEGNKSLYAHLYFEMLKLHDEFGYLEEGKYSITFDSKQNLDENYQGNWFYYYK